MTVAALEQAITFLSRADLIATARQQSLPAGVTELLKISSGDEVALLNAQESSRFSREDVKHAAQFYVQQILFAPDGDHYRVLGVDSDDAEAKIKLHYRLLVRWLHPDKNSSDWEVVFSDRVNRAWHALRTPERRREYDAQLETLSAYPTLAAAPSREIKPVQWRQSQNDERFMSARTIKRLPIAMFGLLGVSAVFALWWVSQLQPRADAAVLAAVDDQASSREPLPDPVTKLPEALPGEPVAAPMYAELPLPESDLNEAFELEPNLELEIEEARLEAIEVKPEIKPEVKPEVKPVTKPVTVAAQTLIKTPMPIKPVVEPELVAAKKPAVVNRPVAIKAKSTPLVASIEARSTKTIESKGKPSAKPHTVPATANVVKAEIPSAKSTAQPNIDSDIVAVNRNDAEVKELLQKFSRVYADGNYFALHNLFTKDLNIIGAPSQRKVLHGYRRLFQTSQHREIAIKNITWLESDKKITVVANFQSEVLPLGGSEAESSHGNIRLDLRMENGELKIIRLQSDAKNGS